MAELFEGMNDRVRLLIGADNDVLTNAMIESFDFGIIAKNKVDDMVAIGNPTQEQQELINACYVYQTALNAIPIIYNDIVKMEQTTHMKVEYKVGKKFELIETISDRFNTCLLMLGMGVDKFTTSVFTISNSDDRYEGDKYHI